MGSLPKQFYPNSDIALFLDVDGVLNSNETVCKTPEGYVGVSGEKVKILRKIVQATKCKIILSSSWRTEFINNTLDGLYLAKKLKQQELYISDITIMDRFITDRGLQICFYLKNHPQIKHIIILDDAFEQSFANCGLTNHFIHTDYMTGLVKNDIEKAINISKEPINEKAQQIINNLKEYSNND